MVDVSALDGRLRPRTGAAVTTIERAASVEPKLYLDKVAEDLVAEGLAVETKVATEEPVIEAILEEARNSGPTSSPCVPTAARASRGAW